MIRELGRLPKGANRLRMPPLTAKIGSFTFRSALASVLTHASKKCTKKRCNASICKIGALWQVVLVAGASALSLDRRLALRAAAVAAVHPEAASAVLACVDGQARGAADSSRPRTTAQSAEAVKRKRTKPSLGSSLRRETARHHQSRATVRKAARTTESRLRP